MLQTYDENGNPTDHQISVDKIAYPHPDSYGDGFHRVHLVSSAGGQDVRVRDTDLLRETA